jgi:hypothetical protein
MPPLSANRECEILRAAARRLGWHPFDVPMLRNSVPYNGRQACMRCRWCIGHACEVNAKNGTHNTVIPTALATGNCEIRVNVGEGWAQQEFNTASWRPWRIDLSEPGLGRVPSQPRRSAETIGCRMRR